MATDKASEKPAAKAPDPKRPPAAVPPKPTEKQTPPTPLSDDGRPATQKIARALPPGAGEALGGAPYSLPAAIAAAPASAAKAAPVLLGNPTFDPPSPEVIERRESIAAIKAGVIHLVAAIQLTTARLRPRLEALSANSAEVRAKEDFDTAEVESFFATLEASIEQLKKA